LLPFAARYPSTIGQTNVIIDENLCASKLQNHRSQIYPGINVRRRREFHLSGTAALLVLTGDWEKPKPSGETKATNFTIRQLCILDVYLCMTKNAKTIHPFFNHSIFRQFCCSRSRSPIDSDGLLRTGDRSLNFGRPFELPKAN